MLNTGANILMDRWTITTDQMTVRLAKLLYDHINIAKFRIDKLYEDFIDSNKKALDEFSQVIMGSISARIWKLTEEYYSDDYEIYITPTITDSFLKGIMLFLLDTNFKSKNLIQGIVPFNIFSYHMYNHTSLREEKTPIIYKHTIITEKIDISTIELRNILNTMQITVYDSTLEYDNYWNCCVDERIGLFDTIKRERGIKNEEDD